MLSRRMGSLGIGVATTVKAILGNVFVIQRDIKLVSGLGVNLIESSNGQESREGLFFLLDQCNHLEIGGIIQAMLGYTTRTTGRGTTSWSGSLVGTCIGPVIFATTDVAGTRGSRLGTTTRLGVAVLLKFPKLLLDFLDFSH
jgi:hypothetical protein